MQITGQLKDSVKVIPDVALVKRAPGSEASWEFGLGEIVYLAFAQAQQGVWSITLGGGNLLPHAGCPGEAMYFCPASASAVELSFKAGGAAKAIVRFNVIRPELEMVRWLDIHKAMVHPNAGFKAAFMLKPDKVSFARVALRECGSHGGTNRQWQMDHDPDSVAIFLSGKTHTSDYAEHWNSEYHKAPRVAGAYALYAPVRAVSTGACAGCEVIRTVEGVSGTVAFIDKVYSEIIRNPPDWANAPAPARRAEWHLDIPVCQQIVDTSGRKPPDNLLGNLLATNVHRFEVAADGTMKVSKGGCSVTFGLNSGAVNPTA